MPNLLTRLARLDRTKVFLGTLAVGLLGLFLPGIWGAIVLYAAVAGLAALLGQTWRITPSPVRISRLVVLAGLAAIATTKIT
jgi:hypothetical protein